MPTLKFMLDINMDMSGTKLNWVYSLESWKYISSNVYFFSVYRWQLRTQGCKFTVRRQLKLRKPEMNLLMNFIVWRSSKEKEQGNRIKKSLRK